MFGNLRPIIEGWVERNLALVASSGFATNHFDELLKRGVAKSEYLALSEVIFVILLEYLLKKNMPVQPLVVIPLLDGANKLQANCPATLESLKQQLHENEPPSLYLLDWNGLKQTEICEEYKNPLPFNLFESASNDVYIYYREHRSLEDIQKNWEFGRAIYIKPV